MCNRYTAIAPIFFQNSFNTIKLTVFFFIFQQIKHTFYKVINIKQFKFCATIIDSEWLIICDRPAKGTNRTIILRTAMPHQIGETINSNLSSRFFSIIKEQFLTSPLATAILAIAEPTC